MGAEFRTEQATPAHCAALAPLMRADDAAEVLASNGFTPAGALAAALCTSEVAYATYIHDELAAVWGVAQGHLGDMPVGIIWAMTSAAADRHPRAFLRASREGLGAMRGLYPMLANLVDARYHKALRWVARLGFQICPPVTYGVSGLPFYPILLPRGARV